MLKGKVENMAKKKVLLIGIDPKLIDPTYPPPLDGMSLGASPAFGSKLYNGVVFEDKILRTSDESLQ